MSSAGQMQGLASPLAFPREIQLHRVSVFNTRTAIDRLACHKARKARQLPLGKASSLNIRLPSQPTLVGLLGRLVSPLQPACNQLYFNSSLQGGFFAAGPQGPLFHLPTCHLRRLPSEHALRCFTGKRVVWIGDSVTRYQVWHEGREVLSDDHFLRYALGCGDLIRLACLRNKEEPH